MALDELEEHVDLHVRVLVVGRLHLGPLPEEGVGLIEEEQAAGVFSLLKDPRQVLLGLSDVLTHHVGDVYPVQHEAELGRQDLGAQRLPSAGFTVEQG